MTSPGVWSVLLLTLIRESGLSNRRFATEVLLRDERTIRRWLSGETAIQAVVRRYLETPSAKIYRR